MQEVYEILLKSHEGKAILKTHSNGLLDGTARKIICQILVNYELKDNPYNRVSASRLEHLATSVTKVFKKELTSTYYRPYQNLGQNTKRAAQGKLYDCLNNLRRKYRKLGVIEGKTRSSINIPSSKDSLLSATEIPDGGSEEANNEAINWLKNSVDPWYMVENYWSRTNKYRLQKLKTDIDYMVHHYFDDFPALKRPTGYLLVSCFLTAC